MEMSLTLENVFDKVWMIDKEDASSTRDCKRVQITVLFKAGFEDVERILLGCKSLECIANQWMTRDSLFLEVWSGGNKDSTIRVLCDRCEKDSENSKGCELTGRTISIGEMALRKVSGCCCQGEYGHWMVFCCGGKKCG